MPNVTLYTDASIDPRCGACGWGAWVRADGWKSGKTFSGFVRMPVWSTTNEAELTAVSEAMATLLFWPNPPGINLMLGKDVMFLSSDSHNTLHCIYNLIPNSVISTNNLLYIAPKRKTGINVTAYQRHRIREIKDNLGRTVLMIKHVKGHQKAGTVQAWVNRECDLNAKRQMRRLREKMKNDK